MPFFQLRTCRGVGKAAGNGNVHAPKPRYETGFMLASSAALDAVLAPPVPWFVDLTPSQVRPGPSQGGHGRAGRRETKRT
jgi:hypothetical protein